MIKIFLIFSLFILWLPNVSANDLPTPRWVTSKNTINCRASYIKDEEGKAITFTDKNLREFSEDVDWVAGVVTAFTDFYQNAQGKN